MCCNIIFFIQAFSPPSPPSIMFGVFDPGVMIRHMAPMMLTNKLKIFPSPWPSQSQRIPQCPHQIFRPVISIMPPAQMMNSLKTVAEAVISLLTMLLQFLIHQLETLPKDSDSPPEMMQTMERTVQELQNQRAMLQSLMSQGAQRRASKGSTGNSTGVEGSPKIPVVRSSPPWALTGPTSSDTLPVTSQRVTQALQRQAAPSVAESTTSVTTRVSNWQMLEESKEDVILDLEGRRIELGAPMPRPEVSTPLIGTKGTSGAMVPRASTQMTIGDWSQCRITWGKKHRGQTYVQVLRTDPGYNLWALARFNSDSRDSRFFPRAPAKGSS